jgi:thiol-disulfide isomerase/thioredoxin
MVMLLALVALAWPAGASGEAAVPAATVSIADSEVTALFQTAHARFQKGRSLQQLHRNTEASKAEFRAAFDGYREAHGAAPDGPMAPRSLYMSGSAKLFLGEPAAAIEIYREVADRYPGDVGYRAKALVKKAQVEKNILRIEEARATLAEYRAQFPDGGPPEQAKEAQRVAASLAKVGGPATEIGAARWFPADASASVGGQPTLLYFWATWCPNCRKEVDFVRDLHERFGGRGLRMIGVTQHTRGQNDESVEAYLSEHRLAFPNAVDRDGVTSRAYSASVVPTAVLVDGAGVVRWHDHPAALSDETIGALLAAASADRS